MNIKLKRLHPDAQIPTYATPGAAAVDLVSVESLTLQPMERGLVATGFAIEIPEGYEAQVRPRSGWALKQGITLPNSPGTIDSDYRGEIKVIIQNLGSEPFEIQKGDRIAQMVIAPVLQVQFEEVDQLSETSRGEGGFGSTGKA